MQLPWDWRPLAGGGWRHPFYTAVFSPDTRLLLVHSPWGEARLLNTTTGDLAGPVLQHDCGPARASTNKFYQLSAAFRPDGTLLATGWIDGTVELWKTDTCQRYGPPMLHQGEVRAVAFSRDGTLLASGSADGTARLWEVATGRPHGPPLQHERGAASEPGQVTRVAFSPDGTLLATTCSSGFVYLWETDTGRLRKRQRHGAWPEDLAFSPDGKLLASASRWTACLWDTATGEPHGAPLLHHGSVHSVQFGPGGKTLVTGSGGAAWFWDVATGQPCGQRLWHEGSALNAALGPDGKYLATMTTGGSTPVRIWRAEPQLCVRMLPHQTGLAALAFAPDSKYVATASRSTVRLWEVATGRTFGPDLEHTAEVTYLAFSRAANVLITRAKDGTVRMWNPDTGQPVDRPFPHPAPVECIALSADGKTLATAGRADREVLLCEVTTGKALRPPLGVQGEIARLTFSPDGKLLVMALGGQNAVWDVAAGTRYRVLGWMPPVAPAEFSPDGRHLAITPMGVVAIRDTASGQVLLPPWPHPEAVWALAYSPDGHWLATASGAREPDTVRLWDLATGRGLVLPPEAARGEVRFSPDGKWLASGFSDGTVRLWPLPAAPADYGEMALRTWTALGVYRDAKSNDAAIRWEDWVELRDLLRRAEQAASPTQYRKAFQAFPWSLAAQDHERQKRWQEAANEYTKLIELMPDNERFVGLRGRAYERLKQAQFAPPGKEAGPADTQP